MGPLEILSNEHGLIRQFLDNLALAVEKLEDEQRPPTEFFEKGVEFARTFADSFHHIKEEHVMFRRLAQNKGGEIDGQIESLRHQHERARNYTAAITEALPGYDSGQPFQVSQVLESAAAYVSLLRNHIHKEDHIFFPMVKEVLSEEEEEQLLVEFNKARDKAREETGAEAFESAHKLVVDMGSALVHM